MPASHRIFQATTSGWHQAGGAALTADLIRDAVGMDARKVLLIPTLGRQNLQTQVSLTPRSQRCCEPKAALVSRPADACLLGSKW